MLGDNDGTNKTPERRQSPRSGDFSGDHRFDPEAVFEVVAEAESAEQAASAMRVFIARGDADALSQAIAIYTRSARARGQTVEKILAELNVLSARERGRYDHDRGKLLEPTELKKLVLRSVLEGFGES